MNTRSWTKSLGGWLCIAIGAARCGPKTADATDSGGGSIGGRTFESTTSNGGTTSSAGNAQTGGTRASTVLGGASSVSSSDLRNGGGVGGTAIGSGGFSSNTGGVGGTTGSRDGSGGSGRFTGGGSSAAGGSPNTGGAAAIGSGGASGGESTNDAPTGGHTAQSTDCSITVKNASYSSKIGSVGIVTWSTSLANVDRAQIDFGVDATYGLTAPVDLQQTEYRTVLLGMKQNHSPYHFRITAWSGNRPCIGSDEVFASKTAVKASSLKGPRVTTQNSAALYGGYLVTEGFRLNSTAGDHAFILDEDGDAVWWYQPIDFGSLSVAKMTYDGKAMWIGADNIVKGASHVGRVSMDGLTFEDMSSQFEGFHHDLAVLPDETVVFITYGNGDCDEVKKRTPAGSVTTIANACKAFGDASMSHYNAVQYDRYDGTVIVSDDTHSAYVKMDLEGNVKWVLNGGSGYNRFDLSGGGASGWTGNHNLHVIGKDRILFFNNGVTRDTAGTADAGATAAIRELALDTSSWVTTETWNYSPNIANPILGDVQRLENGNTLVVFSVACAVHEVGPDGNLVQTLEWLGSSSAGLGYATKRRSLYGPPPR